MTLKLALCPLLLAVAASQPLLAQEAPKAPFTLAITCNTKSVDSNQLEFAGASRTVRRVGEMVVVMVRKTNISDHEITKISDVGDFVGYHFDVLDSSGSPVQRRPKHWGGTSGGEGYRRGSDDMWLKPGQSAMSSSVLTNWLDLSHAGTYTIQAWVRASRDPKSPVVKSNTITLVIQPADLAPR